MHRKENIHIVKKINAREVKIPESAGVYAFWWIGDRSELLNGECSIELQGPGKKPVKVKYHDWWPKDLIYPCLYVGKSTNIRKRFSLHLKRRSPGRLHSGTDNPKKVKPVTTSCQLRWGIEHIFPNDSEPLKTIENSVGFSWRTDFLDNPIAERFFEEDRMIGLWRPWFNIDSER